MNALAALASSAAVRVRPSPPPAAASSLMAWLASSHDFMSAKRCLSAWYDARGRPNEYRSKAHSTVMSKAACMAPTDSALASTTASSELALDLGGGPADLADDGVGRHPDVVEA